MGKALMTAGIAAAGVIGLRLAAAGRGDWGRRTRPVQCLEVVDAIGNTRAVTRTLTLP